MKKLVKNPLDKEIKIMFKGSNYILAPKEEKALEEDVVKHWKRLHGFLEVRDFSEEPVVEISAPPQIPSPQAVMEVKESAPQVEEKPKKKVKPK